MAHAKNHDYHILKPSIWPMMAAVAAFIMLFGAVLGMHGTADSFFSNYWLFLIGAAGVLYVMFGWWGAVISDSHAGDHTPVVQLGLKMGFQMFLIMEAMMFAAFFWAFFKHAMYPMGPLSPAVDGVWPPVGIEVFDPWHLPLINTLILLCSGFSLTWAHHALVHDNNRADLKKGLWITVLLGVLFTIFQAYEYSHAAFGFTDGVYASVFYMATGLHGAHVIIGTLFLFVCLVRAHRGHFTPTKHLGLEAAAWYWHFVDAIWIFLFAAIYIWGR